MGPKTSHFSVSKYDLTGLGVTYGSGCCHVEELYYKLSSIKSLQIGYCEFRMMSTQTTLWAIL